MKTTAEYLTFKPVKTRESVMLSVAVTVLLAPLYVLLQYFAAFFSYCVVNMEGWSHGALLV